MENEAMWQAIGKAIRVATGEEFAVRKCLAIGGGCINSTYIVEDGGRCFFIKLNHASGLVMFEAEADGLREIAATGVIRVPNPVCTGVAADSAFLVLEAVDFSSGSKGRPEDLGRHLADMHRVSATQYGWRRDNTIGSTPQVNTPTDNWPEFWRERRLRRQLVLAASNDYGGALQRKGERLLARLDGLFAGYAPMPSLLHGDLWGGNYAYSAAGEPVIFDPAVYYGDRETDLAMTELFGGFPAAFHAAYRESFPLDCGYPMRKTLYNLYHILNHLNMFGEGYLGQAEGMIEKLLSEAG
ncbi:fructosamine/Ketosamine-3-kinase [Sulfuricella denitrificans skB26]|uniref:Fructosamine/Ketosamine-3-kinase n=1 Tax=Sulfuricella denitrificans (strain DSM 22764 / NBRC 105220 / skB26) TaxID=1163617 RepID=S6AIZ2_SULDS|nr:fructosamine kinase family protein [Sulfuricella denitrificans]BAN36221.1 fructosamine/Ketosamine-3-kinase [Sulfuricella denitrificans skB26]